MAEVRLSKGVMEDFHSSSDVTGLRRRLDNSALAETLFYKGSPGVKYKPS